jgi:hypothetical protein
MFPGYFIEIRKNSPAIDRMADFGVPLEAVYVFFRKSDRLNATYMRRCKDGKIRWHDSNFIGVGCPDPDLFGIAFKDVIMLADIHINRPIPATSSLLYRSDRKSVV